MNDDIADEIARLTDEAEAVATGMLTAARTARAMYILQVMR